MTFLFMSPALKKYDEKPAHTWHGYQLLAMVWLFVPICLPLVIVRLYVQLTASCKRPWRELLLVFAWLALLMDAIIYTFDYKLGLFSILDGTANIQNLSRTEYITIAKLSFASNFTWPLGCWACRALLLLMYGDICSRHAFPKTWVAIAFAWVIVIGGAFGANVLYAFFMCYPQPLSTIWNPDTECWGYFPVWVYVDIAFMLLADILVYVIPIAIIVQLHSLTPIQKAGAAAMFAIGFINILCLVAPIILLNAWHNGHLDSVAENGIMCFPEILQLPTGIIILCIPQLRVIARWKITKRVVNSIISINRDGKREESKGDMVERVDLRMKDKSSMTDVLSNDLESAGKSTSGSSETRSV